MLLLYFACTAPGANIPLDADTDADADADADADTDTDTDTDGSGGPCDAHSDCDNAADEWCVEDSCTFAPDYSGGVTFEEVADEWTVPDGPGNNSDPTEIGATLDTYCGVSAYQNGPVVGDYERFGTFGYEYQCTELAFRFLCTTTGWCDAYSRDADGRYGNAQQWYGSSNNRWINQLDRYPNGGDEPPQAGDILVLYAGEFGHVSVIKEVDLDAGLVTVLEQNCYSCPHSHLLDDDGGYSIANAIGWMRATGTGAERCEAACEGEIVSAEVSGTELTVSGTVACDPRIERWSLVVGDVTVFTDEPGDPSADFAVTVDLEAAGAPDGPQALGLWARPSEGDAELVDSSTIDWTTAGECDESSCEAIDRTDDSAWGDGSTHDIFEASDIALSNADTWPIVTATFSKVDGGAMLEDKACHVRVGSYAGSYSTALERVAFTWDQGESTYTASWYAWSTASDWESEGCNGEKSFYLVCAEDGGDWNHWRAENPIVIEKVCR